MSAPQIDLTEAVRELIAALEKNPDVLHCGCGLCDGIRVAVEKIKGVIA